MRRKDTISFLQDPDTAAEKKPMAAWRVRWIKRLVNPVYMGCMAAVNLIFTIFVIACDFKLALKMEHFTTIASTAILINTFYLFDMIANFVVLGLVGAWQTKKLQYFELVC